jgi:C1A family cysteine protease
MYAIPLIRVLTSRVSVCVDAANWQDYQSGVMDWEECAWINFLDHCVQLVGYDTTASTPYWIVRNSWNTDWGIKGYILLAMGDDTCGIAHESTYVTV